MSKYLQARSTQGYLIHAVPDTRSEHIVDAFAWGKPLCGKVTGRNAWCMPTMRYFREEGNVLEFTATMLMEADKAICISCAKKVSLEAANGK